MLAWKKYNPGATLDDAVAKLFFFFFFLFFFFFFWGGGGGGGGYIIMKTLNSYFFPKSIPYKEKGCNQSLIQKYFL